MSNESKIRRDNDTGYPKYDKFTDYEKNHTHQWGGYSKSSGQYYEGGHGEKTSKDTKKEAGNSFKKQRGD